MRLGGVGEKALARLARQREGLERQVKVSHDRVVKELDAGGVDPDVARGPADPELIAGVDSSPTRSDSCRSYGSLPTSARRSATVSSATESQARKKSEACRSRKMKRALFGGRAGRRRPARRAHTQCVGGQYVESSVEDECRCATHRIQDPLHRGPDTLWRRSATRWPAAGAGRAQQIEEVGSLGPVELQRVRDAVDDAFGHACGIAALEPGVVLGRDACQQGDLLATQAETRRRAPP